MSGVEAVDDGQIPEGREGEQVGLPLLASATFGMSDDGPNPFGPKVVNQTSIKGQVCGEAERWWSAR